MLLVAAIMSSGCETVPDIPMAEQKLFATVKDGQMTREQALLQFGTPSAEFENGRILTYLLSVSGDNQLHPVPRQQAILPDQAVYRWRGVTHNLVLVFRADGILEKHALIKVCE